MAFTPFPELMTGLTDLANAVLAAVFIVLMRKFSSNARPWRWLMWAFFISNLTGAFYHTFAHSPDAKVIIWIFVAIPMAVVIACFTVCALTTVSKDNLKIAAIFNFPFCAVVLGVMIFAHLKWDASIKVYLVYAAVFALGSLAVMINQLIRKKKKSLLLYAIAVVIQIPAAIILVQEKLVLFTIFDHNSLYHFFFTATMILIYFGVKSDEKTEKNENK